MDRDCHATCVRAVKALINNTMGLNALLQNKFGVDSLVASLKNPLFRTKTGILEVLAAICLIPPMGHNLVLNALQTFKERNKEKFRFETLVGSLVDENLEREDAAGYLEYQVKKSEKDQ